MIQELLGGNNVGPIKSDQKPKLTTSPPTSSSSAATAATAAAPTENLRCPRCDSSNTKFCYYNNYNLTQPRHFCKTCRRYWTKGGALRNVPIGGGCRKNRSASTAAGKSPSGRPKSAASSDFIKMGLFSGFDHAPPDPTLLWAAPPQTNYNFLSLLRANQNPNTYPTHSTNNNNNTENSISMKEEGYNGNFLFGFDPARLPSSGLPGPFHGHGESQNNGLHELYQRLRSPPASCYYNESSPLVLGNMGSANSSTAANSGILESAPVGTAGELGFWNAGLLWPADLPTTTNGAYH